MTTDSSFAVGHSIPRVDADDKVTGAAKYGRDVDAAASALWGRILRSPFPHARILSIDASAAKALDGVAAVVTGDDLPPGTKWGRRTIDVSVLAQGETRFVGDPVAVVIADDEEIAQRGVELIEVEYEELPAVIDPEEAMKPGAILVHENITELQGLMAPLDKPTNEVASFEWGQGDVEAGMREADVVVENTFTTPLVHQVYMEPHNQTVSIDSDGVVHVWAPNKAPYSARNQTAKSVGVAPEQIIFHPVTIGGDFGGKGSAMTIPLGYFASKAVGGRAVRMSFDYTDEFSAANPRHASVMRVKTGVKRDGSIVAHDVDVIFNSGAYAGFKPAGHLGGVAGAGGPYRIPNTRVLEHMVYTHTVPCGHMRGPGEPQGVFALESQMDEVAKAIGMDPVEFRLMNFVGDGEPNAIGDIYVQNRSAETMREALTASSYSEAKSAPPSGALIGRGVGVSERTPGSGVINSRVTLHSDGSVVLHTPLFDQGAGPVTVLRQIVAEGMGLTADKVTVSIESTGIFAEDSGVGGSRATNVGSIATDEAVKQAQGELFKLAAELQNWPEEQLVIQGEELVRTDTGERQKWSDLLARTDQPVSGEYKASVGREVDVTGYTIQVAEVAVDPETGQVTLLKLTTAHDTGRIINPMGHTGQINGGMMMGVGYGLMEEMKTEDGRVTTLSFADYKIPSIADIPELRTVILQAEGKGVGPYNIKAIGENANAATAPAIANAVADAVGVRVRDLPVTAERVFAALRERA